MELMKPNEKVQRFFCIVLFITLLLVCLSNLLIGRYVTNQNTSYFDTLLLVVLKVICIVILFIEIITLQFLRYKETIILPLFALWYVICCVAQGGMFATKKEHVVFMMIFAIAILVFPFAAYTGDYEKRKILDIFLLVSGIAFMVVLWIAIFFYVQRTAVYPFGRAYPLGSLREYDLRRFTLQVFGIHFYMTAFLATSFFFVAIYLFVKYRAKKWIVPFVVAEATFIYAAFVSGGRNVMIAFFFGLIYVLAVWLKQRKISRAKRIKIFVILLVVIAVVGIGVGIGVYYLVFKTRKSFFAGVLHLSGRKEIWKSVIPAFKANPMAMIFGFSINTVMDTLEPYIGFSAAHMHNSYMQTLVLTGIPGLILVVLFTVILFVNGYRIFKAGRKDGIKTADKLLFTIPFVYVVNSLFERLLFVNERNGAICNTMFMVFAGYIIFMGKKIKRNRKLKEKAD